MSIQHIYYATNLSWDKKLNDINGNKKENPDEVSPPVFFNELFDQKIHLPELISIPNKIISLGSRNINYFYRKNIIELKK